MRARRTILTAEQALAMPYATLRFVQLGWRVIRIEPTPVAGRPSRGDPNRYVGRPFAGEDRHSYYVAPNVGKEAIALDLKSEEGRAVLRRLVKELDVDVFCTNTLPAHHTGLGIDPESLRAERPELIWCGISAMGRAHPKVPGYDPALQALCGYMDLTGPRDGPPTQCGPPVIDLKAGDEAFTQVLLALLERQETGQGRVVDISMTQCAVSWLQTFLPMLEMGSPPEELKRNGNEHRQFIPVNSYPTSDGFIYMALGSDAQWQRFIELELFASLRDGRYASNEGRRAHSRELHASIGALTAQHTRAEVADTLGRAGIPHAPISAVEEVMELPGITETLLRTTAPDGRVVRLPPPPIETDWLTERGRELPFAPAYGADTDRVLEEAGLGKAAIDALRRSGTLA